MKVRYIDLGHIDFKKAWDYQEGLFQKLLRQKTGIDPVTEGKDHVSGYLLFCEHPHVYTLGKSGAERNLLLSEEMMKRKGISFFRINRGGDITYHGPGQLVGYPILDLDAFHLTIRKYIFILEEAVIRTVDSFGLNGERMEGATGVWLEPHTFSRKICAIGVRASRNVTMHGFAFNVNTDISFFQFINPCGFTNKGSTSLQSETHIHIDMDQVKQLLRSHLEQLIGFTLVD